MLLKKNRLFRYLRKRRYFAIAFLKKCWLVCASQRICTSAARHHSRRSGSPMTRWWRNGTVLKIQRRAAGGDKKQLIQLCTAWREHSLLAGKYKFNMERRPSRKQIHATYMLKTSIRALRHQKKKKWAYTFYSNFSLKTNTTMISTPFYMNITHFRIVKTYARYKLVITYS